MKKKQAQAVAIQFWQALTPQERQVKRPVAVPCGNVRDFHVDDYRPALESEGVTQFLDLQVQV